MNTQTSNFSLTILDGNAPPKPPTFAPGDVLQRGRVRYVLQNEWSFAKSCWGVSKMKRSWITGKWRDVFCVDDIHPHVLIMDGWTHTPGPNNQQAGEVK